MLNRVITNGMAAPDPFIGREILDGQFKILQKIGSGGMGSVYKAHDESSGQTVAIKVIGVTSQQA